MSPARLSCLVPLAALLVGCGPSRKTERLLDEVTHGEIAKAEATAVDLYGDDADEALVRHMEIGLVRHLGGDLEGSLKELDAAAPLVDERRKTSVLDAVGTAVVNDSIGAFQGRAYEHTQVDYYRVLDHLLLAQRLESLWTPPRVLWPKGPAPTPIVSTLEASDHRQRAIIAARRMTINQLKETEDANPGRRYDDDPFARLLAAAAVATLPPSERTETDEQFAAAMLTRALATYQRQAKDLTAANTPFRYEAAAEPALARTLYLRHLLRYDPEEAQRQLEARQMTAAQVRLPPGTGSVLVLHHAGFVARPEPLQIGIGAVGFASPKGATCISWGQVVFVVEGPGSEIAKNWVALPIPGDAVQTLLAPGGAAVIGFELPAHRPDVRAPAPARVTVGTTTLDSEVLCDLDAYARATLLDAQPRLLLRTLLRVVAKQAVVAGGSRVIRDQNNPTANLLGFAVNLVGSVAMTATESADLRAWNTLPDRVEGALLDLPAGSHAVTVTTSTGPCDLGQVRVVPGRLTVVALRSPDTMRSP